MVTKKKTTPLSITKKIGNWSEMTYDRMLTRNGISWLRVKDGMEGQGNREDWVADIPECCVSVHNYQWKKPYWGIKHYPSFHAAMDGQILVSIGNAKETLKDLQEKVERLTSSIETMEKAMEKEAE